MRIIGSNLIFYFMALESRNNVDQVDLIDDGLFDQPAQIIEASRYFAALAAKQTYPGPQPELPHNID